MTADNADNSYDPTRLTAVRERRRSGDTPTGATGSARVDMPASGPWAPPTVLATLAGLDLHDWVGSHRDQVQALLAEHGAVRLRGMAADAASFGATVAMVAGDELLDYTNRSTPRSRVDGQVYTSTEYSPDLAIPMHSEQSYTTSWPLLLGFYSDRPASSGGQTPLARTDEVLDRLPGEAVDRFTESGVRYERWYHPNVDLPWQEVFQTDQPAEVDRSCAAAGIEASWHDGLLHTSQLAQATVRHPVSGRRCWFNQANLFHPAALPESVVSSLRATYGERMPRTVRYGDGAPIDPATVHLIEAQFQAAAWAQPWWSGDVVLVDNMAVSHGRQPYRGDRRVLVAMAGVGTATEGAS